MLHKTFFCNILHCYGRWVAKSIKERLFFCNDFNNQNGNILLNALTYSLLGILLESSTIWSASLVILLQHAGFHNTDVAMWLFSIFTQNHITHCTVVFETIKNKARICNHVTERRVYEFISIDVMWLCQEIKLKMYYYKICNQYFWFFK